MNKKVKDDKTTKTEKTSTNPKGTSKPSKGQGQSDGGIPRDLLDWQVKELGLINRSMNSYMDKIMRTKRCKKIKNRRIQKIYKYNSADGRELFQVVRYDPKDFLQRRRHKDSFIWGLAEGWYQNDEKTKDYYRIKEASTDKFNPPHPGAVWFNGIEPVLYHLPEIIRGVQKEKNIYVCEGEEDADNLSAKGFTTTTCPMGAGKWRSSYTEALKGSHIVVVIADKDKPGRAHAQDVARELYSIGITVKVIEMPNIKDKAIKDVSDWLAAGGNRTEFIKLLKKCPKWAPLQDSKSNTRLGNQELIELNGDPYYSNQEGTVTGINEAYWAGLHQYEHFQLFYDPDEKEFYRYNEASGLYRPISPSVIKLEIGRRILEISREIELPSLARRQTNHNLNQIVERLKGIGEKKNAFKREKKFIHVSNGVILIRDNGEIEFCPFSPNYYSRNQCPIPYDPSATCERFLNELVYPAMTPGDAVLLQKYAGLSLLGNNLIQRLLILEGMSGCSKTTLARIFQSLVGQDNVTELRTKYLGERFELFRYLKKTFIVAADVPGQFLSDKGASVIKRLIGGDWFDPEQKGGTGSFPMPGTFCVLMTSNSRLQVRLDGDTGAWKRRLLIIRFKGPAPAKIIPEFDKLLIRDEGSGILNWALQGLKMLIKDINAHGHIRLAKEQKRIVSNLLAESDSIRRFLVACVVKDEDDDLTIAEIEEAYADYCAIKGWNTKPSIVFHREMKDLMLELFQTPKSQSIKRDRKDNRGFRHVAFKKKD